MIWKALITGLLSTLLLGAAPSAKKAPENMALIPAGSYTPLYTVGKQKRSVAAFYLDRYLVTQAEFLSFVKAHPRWRRSQIQPVFAEKDYLKDWPTDLSLAPDSAQRPVTYVSWFAAKAYCAAQGKRLPSINQWELAAQASETTRDGTHEAAFRERILEWYGQPTPEILPEVGKGFKNVYGVYDMHGVVWEWVRNFNSNLITGESREDSGINRNLFCAAGSVGSVDPSDYAAFMRFAFRSSLKARFSVKNLGFRCAKEVAS